LLLDLKRLKRDTSGESISAAVPAVTPPAKRSYFWPVAAGGVVVLLLLALLLPLTVTGPTEAIDSIAVLPFENRSGDPELEYVSDGIAEGIINRLSQLPSLNKVISSSSVRRYKGKEADAGTVAQEVGVRGVVMGSMTTLGENIRINVELIDGENNSTLWGETYTRPRSELYEIEEYLSREIADALGIQLSGEEEERLSRRYTENIEAHEAYLKGKADLAKFTIEGTQKAIQYFQEAIEKDPNYALAYTALAQCYQWLGQPLRAMPKREAMPRAEELAMKALEIDNSLSEAHSVLGFVKLVYDWDWAEAEKEFKLAIELNPSSAQAHLGYGFFLEVMGRFDEAIKEGRRSQQLDPLNRTVAVVEFFHNARRYDEAIEEAQTVLEINPNFQAAYRYLSWPYEAQGMYQEAAAAYQRSLILGGATEEEVAGLSDAATLGAEAYWRWKLDYFTEKAKLEHVSPFTFAEIYSWLGEKDQAFEWLEKDYEARGNMWLLKVSPKMDPLRDDPRFHDLMRRMNLEP